MAWQLFGIISLLILTGIFLPSVFAQSKPVVNLDQDSYTWTERAYIEVRSIDHVGAGSIFVSVSTKEHSLDNYKLVEAEAKPGTFTGEVTLTGFEYAAYDDGKVATKPTTSGTGPTNGLLESDRDDVLTVMFDYKNSMEITSSTIGWSLGEFRSDVDECTVNTFCQVIVYEPDMNLHPDRLDHLYEVLLFSDTDPVGIDVVMVETGDDTGIFSWDYSLTTTGQSSGDTLRTSPGDSITIKYVDMTPPKPYSIKKPVDVTDVSSSDLKWDGESIKGSTLKLKNNDGAVVFPDNIDAYFPYNKGIKDRIRNLVQEGQLESGKFSDSSNVDYKNNQFIVTKTSIITTSSYDEYVLIFGKDRKANSPVQFKDEFGHTIDETTITQNIQSQLDACGQGVRGHYCNKSLDELTRLVFEKTGKHTIEESMTINQILASSGDSIIEDSIPFSTVSHQNSPSILNLKENFFGKPNEGNILPIVQAQSGQFHQTSGGIFDLSFLNGFTVGFGYERDWSYEFSVAGMMPISIHTHIENGLGMGLRIPINLHLEIDAIEESGNSKTVRYDIKHRIATGDIDSFEYVQLGLEEHQTFGGKEFNMYLGPRAEIEIKILDRIVFQRDQSIIPVDKLTANDFIPPLGSNRNEETITDYTIPCELTKVCYTSDLATIGLVVGGEGKLSGGQITLDSEMISPKLQNQKITFSANNQEKTYSQRSQVNDPDSAPYEIKIDNITYYSNLHIMPNISLETSFEPWIFPMSHSEELVELPRIEFKDIVINKHKGVESQFMHKGVVPEFQEIALMILGSSIAFVVLFARKFSPKLF